MKINNIAVALYCSIILASHILLHAEDMKKMQDGDELLKTVKVSQVNLNDKNDLEQMDKMWKLIIESSHQPNFDQTAVWNAMVSVLDFTSKRVNELAKDPAYHMPVFKNVAVDGLPIAGMSVDAVTDPVLKVKYQAAIDENERRLLKANYRVEWYHLFDQMIAYTKLYIQLYEKDNNVLKERVALLNNYDKIRTEAEAVDKQKIIPSTTNAQVPH